MATSPAARLAPILPTVTPISGSYDVSDPSFEALTSGRLLRSAFLSLPSGLGATSARWPQHGGQGVWWLVLGLAVSTGTAWIAWRAVFMLKHVPGPIDPCPQTRWISCTTADLGG
jgi:hypothetical protein